ncbi:multisubunit sodium/proton antiporter MrpF subunit [Sinobaca qinghaiensis]|uniref:Multisubunit sodium/proton antiporter MrpF subunit n=1 Tax=Sinobaca qinghaiensis TaxID=342944 RepID=A0A419V3U7_9BACL|nr:Na(+)/H(+) antiporter subunit F1 [Sinobaca qinghaiensis]RKD73066.1 multisubunit sodium/proton antiporter MrpF subunit [Sinobaca qinghaiensis]
MFTIVVDIALIAMAVSLVLCTYRVIAGPTVPDRIVALDAFGLNMVGFVGLLMISLDTAAFSEVILMIAILAFLGSVALAKYWERGLVIDRNPD